jgi:hypothetical protein
MTQSTTKLTPAKATLLARAYASASSHVLPTAVVLGDMHKLTDEAADF